MQYGGLKKYYWVSLKGCDMITNKLWGLSNNNIDDSITIVKVFCEFSKIQPFSVYLG